MKEITVNGKTVKTNIGETYRVVRGDRKDGWSMQFKEWVLDEGCKYRREETDKEMLERLVAKGYTTIRFVETTTAIRGFHNTWAYAKR